MGLFIYRFDIRHKYVQMSPRLPNMPCKHNTKPHATYISVLVGVLGCNRQNILSHCFTPSSQCRYLRINKANITMSVDYFQKTKGNYENENISIERHYLIKCRESLFKSRRQILKRCAQIRNHHHSFLVTMVTKIRHIHLRRDLHDHYWSMCHEKNCLKQLRRDFFFNLGGIADQ